MSQSSSFPWGPVAVGAGALAAVGLYFKSQSDAEKKAADEREAQLEAQLRDANARAASQPALGTTSGGAGSSSSSIGGSIANLAGSLFGFSGAESDLLGQAFHLFGI